MKQLAVAACAALMLAACATPNQQSNPVGANASSGLIVAGTLSLGPCEMSLGSYYTRAQVVMQKATRRLNDGRITIDQARIIRDRGANLLAMLDAICPLERQGRLAAARTKRDAVQAQLQDFESMIQGDAK